MKTTTYNPSPIEVALSDALVVLEKQLSKELKNMDIIKMENKILEDNPLVTIHLLDNDGDPHEVVIKIIQKPDKF